MEEIKFSYPGVNKLIEDYCKIYVATFVKTIDFYKLYGETEIHSSVFYNLKSAKEYIVDLFTQDASCYFNPDSDDSDDELSDKEESFKVKNFKSLYFTNEKFDISKDVIEAVKEFNEIVRITGICYFSDIKETKIK